ncbi:MAG: hypothetical protein AB7Q81_09795 [Gammaproteobacteria bacterium]
MLNNAGVALDLRFSAWELDGAAARRLFGVFGGYVVGLTRCSDAGHLGHLRVACTTSSLLAQVTLYLTDAHARHGGG